MSAAMVGWLDRHTRACVWTLAMVAVALRALLAAYSPWSFGYVWDLYHEAIQRLYATGHLPVSTDCWECWQPPLLFLASWPLYAIGRIVYPTSPWPDADLTMFTVTSQSKGAGTKTNIGLRVDESAEIASQGG